MSHERFCITTPNTLLTTMHGPTDCGHNNNILSSDKSKRMIVWLNKIILMPNKQNFYSKNKTIFESFMFCSNLIGEQLPPNKTCWLLYCVVVPLCFCDLCTVNYYTPKRAGLLEMPQIFFLSKFHQPASVDFGRPYSSSSLIKRAL